MKPNVMPWRSSRGGVKVRVIFAAMTLLCIGAAIGYFLYDYQQQFKEHHRKAGRISEYGLQTALEEISVSPSWNQGFVKTPYDGGWYTVSLHQSIRNDTTELTMTAEGHMGNASDKRVCVLTLSTAGNDSVWIQRSLH